MSAIQWFTYMPLMVCSRVYESHAALSYACRISFFCKTVYRIFYSQRIPCGALDVTLIVSFV